MIEKKKVLILTGDAGMGHRSAAEAIQKAMHTYCTKDCEIVIENPLNHPKVPKMIRESQSDYDTIVKNLPELYKFGYEISDSSFPVKLMEGGFTIVLLNIMRQTIKETQPDLIITTYPIFQAPLINLIRSDKLEIPLIVVVTDLVTVHQVWFNKAVTRCTVPTEEVRDLALKAGLAPEQIVKTGIPVDPQILALKEQRIEDLRAELEWEKALPTLLVVGSPRIPALIEIVRTIDASGYDLQLTLVAGGNDQLLEEFNEIEWQHPTKIYDFVDFIPRLMRASNIIICKAGGLIVTESLASGLPLMLVHVLPGQEKGNADYIVEHEAGVFCKSPLDVLETLSSWLRNDQARLKTVAKNAEQLGKADAAREIAVEAWKLLRQNDA